MLFDARMGQTQSVDSAWPQKWDTLTGFMVKYGHHFLHFTYYINVESMIKNFKDKKTEEFFSGRAIKQFSGFKKPLNEN